jgi:hypothetical protein
MGCGSADAYINCSLDLGSQPIVPFRSVKAKKEHLPDPAPVIKVTPWIPVIVLIFEGSGMNCMNVNCVKSSIGHLTNSKL